VIKKGTERGQKGKRFEHKTAGDGEDVLLVNNAGKTGEITIVLSSC